MGKCMLGHKGYTAWLLIAVSLYTLKLRKIYKLTIHIISYLIVFGKIITNLQLLRKAGFHI